MVPSNRVPPEQPANELVMPQRRGHGWLSALIIGLLLFVISILVMFWTENSNLYPTVIIIGNFLIPIVFVIFLYDHQNISSLSAETIAKSFGMGGILGTLGAAVLEALLVPPPTANGRLSFGAGMLVGLIEEGCKILAVVWLARKMRHTSALDGLLLGAAVGMGFAALESTGYAFTTFMMGQGHFGSSIVITIFRGLLAPFGHGTWTAILASVLFHNSYNNRFHITPAVIITYLFVSILHGAWDGLPQTIYLVIPPGIPLSVSNLVISCTGLIVLIIFYRVDARPHLRQPARG
ncbi:PrsW family intramembrane metalloprotease [Dictyobacter arantiisoli]|uniref:Protease PrsW n=1 Tax=Dictyobacter arantiisoli TaxID=2014874 RepID=A0A5A5T9G8_9CHLR|nr:PrsW family glutamic-type intramembrane protease [Dictyobacter arantiisoli]GCF07806.1 hypothetical protein KDI_13700 [Dictyobacter arantiisoli]